MMKEMDTNRCALMEGDPSEQSPQESQTHPYLLLDQLPVGVFYKDKEGRYIFGNSWFCRLKEATPDELVGKTPDEVAAARWTPKNAEHPEKLRKIKLISEGANHHKLIMATGQAIKSEERYVGADGKELYLHAIKGPLLGPDGTIIGSQGILLDITAIKEAEAKVEEMHKQLLQTSRQAGMAEVATSVLHNVGNVLNSVNVSASLLLDNARKSNVAYLGKAIEMLNEHAADLGAYLANDPKGRQLPGYLNRVSEQLTNEQQQNITELESLRENIEHIKEIVAMQQNYAKVSGVAEIIKVADLVEDALRMNAGALARHEVALVREYTDVPAMSVEKHKVLQILVNIIRNAKYACDESGRQDKQIRLKISTREQKVCIAVIDNGVGIPPENRTRIFNHGFTTRKDGHGFGLHNGALAASELGGTLIAHSDGPGQGATFTLELPLQPPENGS
jgi:PAS domain S-box-containing protein